MESSPVVAPVRRRPVLRCRRCERCRWERRYQSVSLCPSALHRGHWPRFPSSLVRGGARQRCGSSGGSTVPEDVGAWGLLGPGVAAWRVLRACLWDVPGVACSGGACGGLIGGGRVRGRCEDVGRSGVCSMLGVGFIAACVGGLLGVGLGCALFVVGLFRLSSLLLSPYPWAFICGCTVEMRCRRIAPGQWNDQCMYLLLHEHEELCRTTRKDRNHG